MNRNPGNCIRHASIDRDRVAAGYPLGLEWDIKFPGEGELKSNDLPGKLDNVIKTYSDHYAIHFMGKKFTYRQLGDLINRAAKGLQQHGIGPGNHVGLYMPNTPYYPIMFYALLKVGARVVNYNTMSTQSQISDQLKDSDTDTLVTVDLEKFHDRALALQKSGELERVISCPFTDMLPAKQKYGLQALNFIGRANDNMKLAKKPENDNNTNVKHGASYVYFNDLIANDGHYTPVINNPTDVAVLQPTGGTTGGMKHAILSHFNLVANTEQNAHFNLAKSDTPPHSKLIRPGEEKVLAALPYFHVFGMMVAMITPLEAGAELLIEPDPAPEKIMKTIQEQRPRIIPAVPRLLQKTLDSPKRDLYDLSSIETVISGGEALPTQLKEDFETFLGKSNCICQGYGLTEASPAVAFTPPSGENKPASSGLPLPRTEITITDTEHGTIQNELGVPGEIWVRGPQVMQGYYKKEEETASVLRDGWLRTGDIGYLDEDYYLHVIDRAKRMINIAGENIYPGDIEAVITTHPAVAEAAVIGVKEKSRGEAAKAFIHYRDDLSEEQIPDADKMRAYLAERLSQYQIPRYIEHHHEPLPRTSVGKLDFKSLEQQEENRQVIYRPSKASGPS